MFMLDKRLEQDCIRVGEFDLCMVLLLNDANFPWVILVPKIEGVSELYDLSEQDQQQFMKESSCVALMLKSLFKPDKLNIAAIGNKVRQLHIHHIARFENDKCWPETVWGYGGGRAYTETEKSGILNKIRAFLDGSCGFKST